MDMGNL